MQMVKPKMIKHVVDGINLLEFTRDAILNEGKNNKLVKKKNKKNTAVSGVSHITVS